MTDNEYTPTEDEMRRTYCDSYYAGDDADADFTRGIAKVKAEAWDEGQRAGAEDMGTAMEIATTAGRNGESYPEWTAKLSGPTPNPYRATALEKGDHR